jgi:hypothetical protein
MNGKSKMTRKFGHFFLLVLLKLLMPVGCAQAGDTTSKTSGPLNQVVQPDQAFGFDTERDLWVEVSVNDVEGAPAGQRTVEVLEPIDGEDGGFRVIERGLTDEWGNFDRQIRVPSSVKNVLIRVGVFGIDNSALVPVDATLNLHHEFG